MIHFLSFAATNMAPSLRRIGKEAQQSGFFDKIHLYNEKKLDRNFRHSHSQYFKDYPRGYGYWIWKSYLISKIMLEKMHQGDILVYLDAGCEVHASGRKRWEEYKEILNHHSMLVFVQESQQEIRWTKYDLLAHFLMADNDVVKYSPQFLGGVQIMKKDDFTMQFVSDWYNTSEEYRTTLLCDAPSRHPEFPEFRENRHDQSIFSLLCKKRDPLLLQSHEGEHIRALSVSETYSRDPEWKDMDVYPFWAKRNKEIAEPNIFQRIVRRIIRCASNILTF